MSLLKKLPKHTMMFTDLKFLQVVQDHFPIFRKRNEFTSKLIDTVSVDIYRGDFHGLLLSMGVDKNLLHINTLFNGYHSPLDFKGDSRIIDIVKPERIHSLASVYEVQMQ